MEVSELARILSPVVLLVAVTTAIAKTGGMKGDLVQKWRQRVQVVDAGLSERATDELRDLQRSIRDLLGTGDRFDPGRVVADPGILLSGVQRFQRLIEARNGLQGNYEGLLTVPRVFFWGLVALDISIVLVFICVATPWPNEAVGWLGWLGGALAVSSALVLVRAFWRYRRYQEGLADADILSSPRRDDG